MTYDLRPMLASPTTGTAGRRPIQMTTLVATHAFDEKVDGVRALMVIENGQIKQLSNRNGVSRMGSFPELDPEHLPDCVLDGEIVALNGITRKRSFGATAIRDKNAKPTPTHLRDHPAIFLAFDILYWDGQDVRTAPWHQRRSLLDALVDETSHVTISTTRFTLPDSGFADGLHKMIVNEGGEGTIAKDMNARYQPGRQRSWLKFKHTHSITCVAVGYEPGTGSRIHFGAMRLALVGPHGPVEVGRVGTGFTMSEIDSLKGMLDKGTPFPVEIECLNVTKTGQLRFPVYKGLRTDLSVVDATLDQLTTIPSC